MEVPKCASLVWWPRAEDALQDSSICTHDHTPPTGTNGQCPCPARRINSITPFPQALAILKAKLLLKGSCTAPSGVGLYCKCRTLLRYSASLQTPENNLQHLPLGLCVPPLHWTPFKTRVNRQDHPMSPGTPQARIHTCKKSPPFSGKRTKLLWDGAGELWHARFCPLKELQKKNDW